MNLNTSVAISILASLSFSVRGECYGDGAIQYYSGTCDASAAVPISKTEFVVAGDENSVLNVYTDGTQLPKQRISLAKLVPGVNSDFDETELEAATKIGETSFWISSHTRTKRGDPNPMRHWLIALQFVASKQGTFATKLIGRPYRHLVLDLLKDKRYQRLGISNNLEVPKTTNWQFRDDMNIEGLTVWHERKLLIGLRSPLIDERAVLIPLENPFETINGTNPRFGPPVFLDLGGLAIRSIEFRKTGSYLICAGPRGGASNFGLFEWSGDERQQPRKLNGVEFGREFTPEALLCFPNDNHALVLSDDGSVRMENNKNCKELEKMGKPVYFKSMKIDLDRVSENE